MDNVTRDYKEYLFPRLQDPKDVAAYLNACLEEDDPSVFLLALRYVADAQGIAKVAASAELNRESLYRMLSDQGNPRLSSMLALLEALGVQLQVKPLNEEAIAQKIRDEVRPTLAISGRVEDTRFVGNINYNEQEATHPRKPEPAAA